MKCCSQKKHCCPTLHEQLSVDFSSILSRRECLPNTASTLDSRPQLREITDSTVLSSLEFFSSNTSFTSLPSPDVEDSLISSGQAAGDDPEELSLGSREAALSSLSSSSSCSAFTFSPP